MWIWIFLVFLVGMYVYMTNPRIEGMTDNCPDLLIQDGELIYLKNSNMEIVPGVNPIVFQSLKEYTEFVKWQTSQGKQCPVLILQKAYDVQNNQVYNPHEFDRESPSYQTNSLSGPIAGPSFSTIQN